MKSHSGSRETPVISMIQRKVTIAIFPFNYFLNVCIYEIFFPHAQIPVMTTAINTQSFSISTKKLPLP